MPHLHGHRVGSDGEPATASPERAIACAVIARAFADLDLPRYRAAALDWLHDGAAAWLDALDLDQVILEAIAARAGPDNTVFTAAQQRTLQAVSDLEDCGEKATAAAADALTGAWSGDYHIPRLRAAGLLEQVGERGGCRLTEAGRRVLARLREG